MKKFYLFILVVMMFTLYTGCKKATDNEKKPDPPDVSIINISQESEWDYMVLGKNDYYFVKAKNSSTPEVVLFHSSEANKDYSVFINNGKLDKVVVDDYIFVFRNFNGNKVDLGVVFPNGEVKVLRDLETDYDWDNQQCTGGKSTEAWSDVIRAASRIAAGVPCALSVAAAIGSSGIATPIALWTCGNFLLGLTADVMQNDFEVHNGFTEFTNKYGITSTGVSCSSGDPEGCLIDAAAGALSEWADHQHEIEQNQQKVNLVETTLEYGDAIKYGNYGVTELTFFDYSDWESIVNKVFGSEYRVADWNDLKAYYNNGGNLLELFDGLGLTEQGTSVLITRNGNHMWSSTRYYTATRHEHNKPDSYLAHDNIDNYLISLGSWYGMKLQILAIKK